MLHPVIPVDALIFTRSIVVPGDRDAAYRRIQSGEYSVVTRGVLVDTDLWNAATPEERHRAAARAIGELRPAAVFGGLSAALIWGRPWVGPAPSKPILISTNTAGGNSDRATTMIASRTPFEIEIVNGLRVTGLARSLVDAARRCAPAVAIPLIDHALSPTSAAEFWPASARLDREQLAHELERGTHVGRARARMSVELADGRSGSVGESLSRLTIARLGFDAPALQHEYRDRAGSMFVDFSWAQQRVIGEFDGLAKYVRDEFTKGKDPAEVVIAEKRREDRLRALGFRVARWGWHEVRHPELLAQILRDAGLRHRRSASPLKAPGRT